MPEATHLYSGGDGDDGRVDELRRNTDALPGVVRQPATVGVRVHALRLRRAPAPATNRTHAHMGVNATGTLGGRESRRRRLGALHTANENDSDLRYSEVPLKRKNKTLVKILGGRQHNTTPAGQILGGRDPCNPCGVDAYACKGLNTTPRKHRKTGRMRRNSDI